MEIQFQSDIGKRRRVNQDYVAVFTNQIGIRLVVLADGMGGHLAGDVASKMAVHGLGAAWEASDIEDQEKAGKWLIQTIQKENEEIYQTGIENTEMKGMGTTIVATVLFSDSITVAHVGDSRAYAINEQAIRQLTEDHSLVQELFKSGEITEEMAASHPQKNVLTRSVGVMGTVEVTIDHYTYQPNDYLLLCSDGLTNMVNEPTISAIVRASAPLAEKAQQLITAANDAGGTDNITVVLVHFKEEAPR